MQRDRLISDLRIQMPDHLPVGICVLNSQLQVVDWNYTLTRWTGFSAEQITNQPLTDFYPQLNQPRYRSRLEDALSRNLPVVFSAAIHKHFIPVPAIEAGKGLMYQEAVVRPIRGCPGYVVISISDVTARFLQTEALRRERDSLQAAMTAVKDQAEALRAAQIRATQASQTKSEFLANVSHEIRSPMTAILGFTEILGDEDADDEIRRSAVETIRSNGEHLLELINDILDLSRIEAGRMELEKTECDLRPLLTGLQDTFTLRAQQRGITFQLDVDPLAPGAILTDPLRLRQLLINLLSNSLKFTEQGSISVNVSPVNRPSFTTPMVCFAVTDTGIGMDDAQIARLFQPFVQVDSSATRRFAGTGLGLAICKRVAEMLGGRIEVASKPGSGSCFRIYLPAHAPTEVRDSTSSTENTEIVITDDPQRRPRNGGPLSGLRILLAEDGPDNQRLIEFRLKRDGATFTTVGNGRLAVDAALEALTTPTPFDVVLMDMQMPELDGYEATRELRCNNFAQPVIALTAHAMSHDRQLCLDAGCTAYHTKPVQWSELRELILNRATHPLCLQQTGSQAGSSKPPQRQAEIIFQRRLNSSLPPAGNHA